MLSNKAQTRRDNALSDRRKQQQQQQGWEFKYLSIFLDRQHYKLVVSKKKNQVLGVHFLEFGSKHLSARKCISFAHICFGISTSTFDNCIEKVVQILCSYSKEEKKILTAKIGISI